MSYLGVKLGTVARRQGHQERVMRAAELKELLGSLGRLTTGQRVQLLGVLQTSGQEAEVVSLLESRLQEAPGCPHCQGLRVVRNGSASGLQRYKCRGCNRTFNALSTTPLAGLRMKDKWMVQQQALQQGLSVHKAAALLGVSRKTSFRWRHRFLQLPKSAKATELTGVVEADETFFLRSSKGQRPGRKPRKRGGKATRKDRGMDLIPILVARDRAGATADFLLDAVSKACMSAALKPHIHSDAILCTDGSAAMAAAAQELGVQHEPVNLSAGQRVRGPWHIQNVNAYHSRLKSWIHRFRGVATDYLENYLGWFRAIDRASKFGLKSAPLLALAVGIRAHH